jgi:hypothetical protein
MLASAASQVSFAASTVGWSRLVMSQFLDLFQHAGELRQVLLVIRDERSGPVRPGEGDPTDWTTSWVDSPRQFRFVRSHPGNQFYPLAPADAFNFPPFVRGFWG